MIRCPECGGPWLPNHPHGPVAFQHNVECGILIRDDQRRFADRTSWVTRRAATHTERTLLAVVGYRLPAGAVECRITHAPGGDRRDFPGLEPPA